ncbi:MAG: ATP phosphoribosyltransferase [Candidatus Bathyarchaeota archaeon]|nr:ATP phosphoribosyltransferase [Candidatus Bathyarchaeota archaeon]MDH5687303.1 ATP phosphoribosyltransferase [Candidatus Bathyarchaeota archaeon]
MDRVRFAIPKGHLAEATFRTLERAGYIISGTERTYRPTINDPRIDLKILRPQEIPIFVNEGLQDVGITGLDWIEETHADVEVLVDLEYSRAKLVVAVPKSFTAINSLSDLLERFIREDVILKISTEYLNLSAEYLKTNPVYQGAFGDADPVTVTPWWRRGENQKVSIYLSFGATEAKPPEDADAIVEVAETGASLEQNDLKVIETLMESTAVLIGNKDSIGDESKREKIYDILTLLKGVVDGRKKLHIFVNVSKDNLSELLKMLPALKGPTVSPLSDKNWYSVNTVIEKERFLQLIPTLRKLAQGLVVYEPRQVLPLEEIASGE